MDSTGIEDPPKPVTGEITIAGAAASLSMMETMHQDNSPLVTTGDTDEATSDGASSIIQALHLVQVVCLAFAGIIALLYVIFDTVAFAVLVVASASYFGFFWYNVASSVRTWENAIALAIRSLSVAAVLAASSLPLPANYNFFSIIVHLQNIALLLVVSVFDWRWNGLFS